MDPGQPRPQWETSGAITSKSGSTSVPVLSRLGSGAPRNGSGSSRPPPPTLCQAANVRTVPHQSHRGRLPSHEPSPGVAASRRRMIGQMVEGRGRGGKLRWRLRGEVEGEVEVEVEGGG